MYVNRHSNISTNIQTDVSIRLLYKHIDVCVYIYICIYRHVYKTVCMSIYIYIYIHTLYTHKHGESVDVGGGGANPSVPLVPLAPAAPTVPLVPIVALALYVTCSSLLSTAVRLASTHRPPPLCIRTVLGSAMNQCSNGSTRSTRPVPYLFHSFLLLG